MKKFMNSCYFISIFLCIIFSFYFTGCNVELRDETLTAAPSVTQTESGIMVFFKNLGSSKYINIYRREITDSTDTNRDSLPYEKIGIIYPNNWTGKDNGAVAEYYYEDTYVSKSCAYQYCVRYSFTDTKTLSAWSKDIYPKQNSSDSSDEESLTYNVEQMLFADNCLYFPSNIYIQERLEDFEPMLAISNGTSKKIFKLPSTIIETKNGKFYLAGGKENTVPLLSVLSDDFLSPSEDEKINLTVLGIIGQKDNLDPSTENTEDAAVLSTTWTPLAEVSVVSAEDGEELDTISIVSPTGAVGTDWSDL